MDSAPLATPFLTCCIPQETLPCVDGPVPVLGLAGIEVGAALPDGRDRELEDACRCRGQAWSGVAVSPSCSEGLVLKVSLVELEVYLVLLSDGA